MVFTILRIAKGDRSTLFQPYFDRW